MSNTTQNNTAEVDDICDMLNNMNTADNEDSISICANCGKEGSDVTNTCNKCKQVKYCNAACKKKHRHKHKKECERRVAELRDEQLFKQPPSKEECPICMLPMPYDISFITFKTCCGRSICNGCIYAMEMSEGKDLCAFCRMPKVKTDEEDIERIKKLMDKGNAMAFEALAFSYATEGRGLRQDWNKANELFLEAGELGCASGYYNLGVNYSEGIGGEIDKKKAKYYYELAAMGGHVKARHNLGALEFTDGNTDRAFQYVILSARAGCKESLDVIKQGFTKGIVTKDDYASTLRTYHDIQKEMKSDARDAASQDEWLSGRSR